MSDIMTPISFSRLLHWITEEFENHNSIFGIPENKFFNTNTSNPFSVFNEKCATPIGPAAGPHTQLAQNIIAAYLTGARFFELKTVQILDTLEIEKPCIDAEDEAYNTEWSSEFTVPKAYDEYLKAWVLLHYIQHLVFKNSNRDFIFNMSVGYDLKGIKSKKIDSFIEQLKNAKKNNRFLEYLEQISPEISKNISPDISSSLTLSTMHGCPPKEIEAICSYIITEKKLNTFVKLNPTLLGYEKVKSILDNSGYDYIELSRDSFSHDLQFNDAVAMIKRLQNLATAHGTEFGVKLSNTLGVKNTKNALPGDEMYMSGRSLFPLTINLAEKLVNVLGDKLNISYSGGAAYFNISDILSCGIKPITLATDLLKPGGYYRFNQIAELSVSEEIPKKINVKKLISLAEDSLTDPLYSKNTRETSDTKIKDKLPLFDCYVAPCVVNCPIHQDIPQYIHLVEEKKYKEAYELIITKNPLPFITGHICDHPCTLKCARCDYEEPVLIRELKRVAAENGKIPLTHQHTPVDALKKAKPDVCRGGLSNTKIAVIGAGPCGLSAAYFLAKSGLDVTVFDKNKKPGGTVQNIIPDFRLPQSAIDNDIELIKSAGVKFKLGIEGNFSIDSPPFLKGDQEEYSPPFLKGDQGGFFLNNEKFNYIILAIGTGKSIGLKLDGDNKNIIGAIDFLKQIKENNQNFNTGENVVIVGGGNSAMDAARAAVRTKGVKNVSIIYRRTEKQMPADREELNAAKKDGVVFKELLQPVALAFAGSSKFINPPFIKGAGGISNQEKTNSPPFLKGDTGGFTGNLKCQVMKLGEPDSSGRKRPVPVKNKFVIIKCDSLICAIGERVDEDFLKNAGAITDTDTLETIQTKTENIFIGGDALRGPSSVVEAIADGRSIAEKILERVGCFDPKQQNNIACNLQYDETELINAKGVIKKAENENLNLEAKRCLACDIVCDKCVEVCPNRANVAIKVSGFEKVSQIIHIDGMCNECGNCETFCPFDGAPYKEKLTLYWSEKDFSESSSDGFFVEKIDSGYKITLRLSKETISLDMDNNCETKSNINNNDTNNVIAVIKSVIKFHNYLLSCRG